MHQMLFFSMFFYLMSVFIFPIGLYFSFMGGEFFIEWLIMDLGNIPVYYSLEVDSVSLMFSSSVFFISGNVCLFSTGYMVGEAFSKRFSFLVFLFVLSMNILIFSGNLVGVLLGWDGLGLTSFLLVIYYQNSYSLGAGLITVLTNRLGDVGLILSFGLLLSGGHWNIFSLSVSGFVSLLVILGAITKSAQYPFSSWLPMAMAAPTPVSALVHSSTLVTAGVYLLIRFFPVISGCPYVFFILLLLSGVTMVLAGLAAFNEMDFKKIIAYSTLSQLGVMVVSLGLGSPFISFIHLLSHAMFKALMFICAGIFIHYHSHSQDLREMGNLSLSLPVVQFGLVVSNLALCGFPFLSGFYSKDPVYEVSVTGGFNFILIFLMVVGLVLTGAYSIRAVLLSQMGPSNRLSLSHINNNPVSFIFPILLLSGLGVSWGAILNWVLLPPLLVSPISFLLGSLPLSLLVLISAFCYVLTVNKGVVLTNHSYFIFKEGMTTLWFLSFLSSQLLVKNVVFLGGRFSMSVDQGWAEVLSGQGVDKFMKFFSSSMLSVNVLILPTMLWGGMLLFFFIVLL